MLTEEIINEHAALYEELSSLKELQSEDILTLRARAEGTMVTVPDSETGEPTEVEEKQLWIEVFHLGMEGNRAADFLTEKYPEVFARELKLRDLKKHIEEYEVEHFGFLLKNMTPPKMLEILSMLIDKKLKEVKKTHE